MGCAYQVGVGTSTGTGRSISGRIGQDVEARAGVHMIVPGDVPGCSIFVCGHATRMARFHEPEQRQGCSHRETCRVSMGQVYSGYRLGSASSGVTHGIQ